MKDVVARNLVAKHDFNRGGAHRSVKDYVRTKLTVNDALDEYYEPLWDDDESMCDMLDIPYEDVYQSQPLVDFFIGDKMKQLDRPLGSLDVETIAMPKTANINGKLAAMTTFAFATIMPGQQLPVLLIGVMDNVLQLNSPKYDIDAGTRKWWKTHESINEVVRKSQLALWENDKAKFCVLAPRYSNDGSMGYDAVRYETLEDAQKLFTSLVDGDTGHVLGNGPEFDMHIFDTHFPNHKMYKFWDTGSARTAKFLAANKYSREILHSLMVASESYARLVFDLIPVETKNEFLLVAAKHDSLFDVINEVHLSNTILTDAIQ